MITKKVEDILQNNSYPGRGIILGRTPDGAKVSITYFIMGRSENSRNRVFVPTEDGIRTEAYDPKKMVDPSLIIYSPVRRFNNNVIVSNGDQTDTIFEGLEKEQTFELSLLSRTFEPDGPNYTPRISGLIPLNMDPLCYKLSILKSADGNPDSALRFTYTYENILAGVGHFIHTYKSDGEPLPSFEGEPTKIRTMDAIDDWASLVWNSLNEENKVSLYVEYIDINTRESKVKIINKHETH